MSVFHAFDFVILYTSLCALAGHNSLSAFPWRVIVSFMPNTREGYCGLSYWYVPVMPGLHTRAICKCWVRVRTCTHLYLPTLRSLVPGGYVTPPAVWFAFRGQGCKICPQRPAKPTGFLYGIGRGRGCRDLVLGSSLTPLRVSWPTILTMPVSAFCLIGPLLPVRAGSAGIDPVSILLPVRADFWL